ncbi:MAG TPA: hypothetical protein VF912_09830 [Anaeromyxobacter sp.]
MPKKPEEREREDAPRTDLPPVKEPYYEGYFGTDEEEGVVREDEAGDDDKPADRGAAEDAAGGDREIVSDHEKI